MKVLVTGGAGFVGSHVVEALLDRGHRVRALDSLLPQAWGDMGDTATATADLDPRAELVVGDVRDGQTLRRLLADVDAVSHQAGMVGLASSVADFPAYAEHNDVGTAVLLAAMAEAGLGRLVLGSSMVVYGEGRYRCSRHGVVRPGPRAARDLDAGRFEPPCPHCGAPLAMALIGEDAALDPRGVYASTKVAQEHYAAAWARATGGAVAALRYHNVYGPRMPKDTPYAGVASIFRSALQRARPPRVFEDGGQHRDFVHVRDVARANVLALEEPDEAVSTGRSGQAEPFAAYNVASGHPHTIAEMAHALADAYGGPAPVVTGEYRLGDVRHVVASPEKATRDLGFQAEVDFAKGMHELATAPLRGGES